MGNRQSSTKEELPINLYSDCTDAQTFMVLDNLDTSIKNACKDRNYHIVMDLPEWRVRGSIYDCDKQVEFKNQTLHVVMHYDGFLFLVNRLLQKHVSKPFIVHPSFMVYEDTRYIIKYTFWNISFVQTPEKKTDSSE